MYQEEASTFFNEDSSRINEFKTLVNKNTTSFLINFPPIPFSKVIYGCYEANSQFTHGYDKDFDKNLLKKHNLPVCDQIVDLLVETQNQPSLAVQHDRLPILQRLSNRYFEAGLCAILEDINSMSTSTLKKNNIPELIAKAAGMVVKLVDVIYAPINPFLISVSKH